MTDDRRDRPLEPAQADREALGSAPTTPGAASPPPLAAGSTLDLPPDEVPSAPAELPIGAIVGHFVLRRRLGQGGMGIVYAGEDTELGRPVAIKLVRAGVNDPAYRARLRREAQALARLEHPNVVKVYEVGNDGDRVFVAMELVDGETLGAWLKQPRGWREIVAMFTQVGAGLAAVHRAGLVHRDFKPENVLIDREGRARVADFGLARLDRDEASPIAATLTQTGAMMGTPGYMAPEQQFGGDVDARADQYSFCVALREALGGRPLDDARWQLVPSTVRAAIGRGLSYDASDRFASIDELIAHLYETGGRPARRRGIAPVAGALIVVVGGIAAFAITRGSRATSPPHQATAGSELARVDANAPPVALAIADAAVELVPMIVDAGVAADARVRVAHADAHGAVVVDATEPGAVEAAAPPNVFTPTTKHLPAANVGDPAHLPVVRAALRNLGYKGIDLSALATVDKEATATIATAKGLELGIAQVKLGMVKRRHGDCKGATELWQQEKLRADDPDPAPLWNARAAMGITLCEIEAGSSDEAYHTVLHAWVAGDREEVKFVMAIISYELDRKEDAFTRLLGSEHSPDAQVQAALKLWLDGNGLTLR